MTALCIPLFALLATVTASHGGLLVYEPFDYKPVNDETYGRLAGRNGGLGFGAPWQDTQGEGNDGEAFIYDSRGNPKDLYGGTWGQGKVNWDGVVDNLPTMGGYAAISDWSSRDVLNSTRKLARSAGEMAKANGGVLWLSGVFHFPDSGFFAPVGLALTSDGGGLFERSTSITNKGNAIGVGNGTKFRNGMKRLNPMIWEKGVDKASKPGTDISTKKDNIIILKFEFGETDTVSAWYFTEDQRMSEEEFNKNAISCTLSIEEDTLDTLAFGTIREGNAVDELRIATSFNDVISGSIPARQEVKITKRLYDAKSDQYFLQWTSNPGEIYGLYLAEDAGGYKPCLAALVEAAPGKKETTFGPFTNPRKGDAGLQFEIGLPDQSAPVIERAWGNGTTISVRFSETMLPTTALDPANYAVMKDGSSRVAVSSAKFQPANNTVVLSTAQPLDAASSYTITTSNLTDLANLALSEPAVSLRTWDDNPNGVKVFILAGQSNMVGRGWYDKGQGEKIGGIGSLREQVNQDPENYGYLVDGDGKWREIETMKFWWNRVGTPDGLKAMKGNLTVGYGAGPDCVGPEYGFGWMLQRHYGDQPVLLIKTAWGGKSLHIDFCSPTAAARRDGRIGPYFLQMMDQVHQALDNLGGHFPEFKGKGYQIAGFGWHQGYNDMLSKPSDEAYEQNLVDFIHDIRAEFGKPKLPFSIASTGHGGMKVTPEQRLTLAGQLNVADQKKYPVFAGNVFTIDTRPIQPTVEESPVEDGSHWHNNGKALYLIGKGMGDGMVEMLKP